MNHFTHLPWTPLYQQVSEATAAAGGKDAGNDSWSTMAYYGLAATVLFTVTVYAVEGYLDARQRNAYQKTQFPVELELVVSKIDQERARAAAAAAVNKEKENKKSDKKEDGAVATPAEDTAAADDKEKKETEDPHAPLLPVMQSKFQKAQTYGLDKIHFGMIAHTYDTLESVVFLLTGFLPYIWETAVAWGASTRGWQRETDEIKLSLLFLAMVTVIGTFTSLPFELYSTFQIERKHGFNKQTLGLFFTDKIKSLLLTMVIGGPFVALLLYIIQKGGEYFYLYVWAFMFVFSVFMMTIVPVFIMPLFNKYEPLPDGELKTRIYQLAERLKYPLTKLFVMDGSKRSSHSNAFMFGFGNNKRIVLFDTLLTQVNQDEILAILGHELGHWKLGHTLQNFVITQLYTGAAFYAFAMTYGAEDLYAAFGFNDPHHRTPTIIALLLFFQSLWAPVDKVLSFILTIFSRHNEFAADRFSSELNMSAPLRTGLCKIHLENLGAMAPDLWYSTYHYSHPPLVERLSAMMAYDQKTK